MDPGEPAFSLLPSQYDMEYFHDLYPDAEEVQLELTPVTDKLSSILIWSMVHAALASDKWNDRSATGIIRVIGRTPIKFFSKLQGNIEVSTYSSEFILIRTGVEQIL